MMLDTTTFMIVFVVILGAMGTFIWLRVRSEKKKHP
jgi:hypothetical protein